MAIEPLAAEIIAKIAALFKTMPADAFKRDVLCFGYPDILTTSTEPVAEAKDAAQIKAWHKWHGRVLDADAWFASLDLIPTYWDVVASRGPEQIVNFNDVTISDGWARLPPKIVVDFPDAPLEPSYCLVVDAGTLEHIFCPSNVFALVSRICAIGGYVLHLNPLGSGNHGFWSVHPTAYHDFYAANGFKIEMLAELSGPLEKRNIRAIPATKRFQMSLDGVMLCLARREKAGPIVWPIQNKYVQNPSLKGNVSRETFGGAA